ncbi:MAG: SagB/ThcOx family dehydrogenase [Bacteroidota bacterium]|nr:SagB/ThcOx family dehydrogenase [Bacteroidota bacterium]
MKKIIVLMLMLAVMTNCMAQEVVEKLPKPKTEGGMPLMDALKKRSSSRSFSEKEIDRQMLSNLLWAAWGINRPDGKRTAPSSMNKQELSLYVVIKEGAYLYDAVNNSLIRVTEGDVREACGVQAFVGEAPLNVIMVADLKKLGAKAGDKAIASSWANSGYISQNIYLFCASESLATVVRASIDHEKLKAALKLNPDQEIILGQTVGYPK